MNLLPFGRTFWTRLQSYEGGGGAPYGPGCIMFMTINDASVNSALINMVFQNQHFVFYAVSLNAPYTNMYFRSYGLSELWAVRSRVMGCQSYGLLEERPEPHKVTITDHMSVVPRGGEEFLRYDCMCHSGYKRR